MVVEVEFANLDDAHACKPPDWRGTDVTENNRYKNSALARAGILTLAM